MKLLALIILISSFVSSTGAVKCFQCSNNENNCNSGDCEGEWCVAHYITKNPFANDHEQRVTKSCEKTHPTGFNNDSCVESISPSGRKLSCGCQKDYCNDDKAIQKLPVQSHDDGGPVPVNVTGVPPPQDTTVSMVIVDVVNHTNVATTGSLKCICTESQNCVNSECQGGACTTEVYDETGLAAAGGGIRIGARISKGCAVGIPDGVKDNQMKKPVTVQSDGKTTQSEVTIFYCNDRDYCNNKAAHVQSVLSMLILFLSFAFHFMLV